MLYFLIVISVSNVTILQDCLVSKLSAHIAAQVARKYPTTDRKKIPLPVARKSKVDQVGR